MKKDRAMVIAVLIGLMIVLAMFLAGCSSQYGYIGHTMQTQVQLSGKNFKVVDSVTGISSAIYVLMVFGPLEQNLMDQARRDMIRKANLLGYSKAIVNVTTDVKTTLFYPFFFQKTCYVSGEVVEFIDR